MILSCTVQMKNSLIKFLDYDDQNIDKIKQSTQPTVIFRSDQTTNKQDDELSVYTPQEIEALEH